MKPAGPAKSNRDISALKAARDPRPAVRDAEHHSFAGTTANNKMANTDSACRCRGSKGRAANALLRSVQAKGFGRVKAIGTCRTYPPVKDLIDPVLSGIGPRYVPEKADREVVNTAKVGSDFLLPAKIDFNGTSVGSVFVPVVISCTPEVLTVVG